MAVPSGHCVTLSVIRSRRPPPVGAEVDSDDDIPIDARSWLE
eukprot:gene46071-5101_t